MMRILTVVGIVAFYLGQTAALSAQDKTDAEALALIAKARQQEQKIIRGRVKVRQLGERLSENSIAELHRAEQMLLKTGLSTYDASLAVRNLRTSLQTQLQLPPNDYTFTFNAMKLVYLEKGTNNHHPYRDARTEKEHIHAMGVYSLEKEGSPEPHWEFESDKSKKPLLVGYMSSVWLGRGWESFAPEGVKAEYRVLEKNADGTIVLLRSNKPLEGFQDIDMKVWMDTRHGLTLTRAQYLFRKSGRVQMDVVYTYDHREDGIYYPKEAVATFFHEDDTGKWVAKSRITSHIEKAEINVPIAQSELELDVP